MTKEDLESSIRLQFLPEDRMKAAKLTIDTNVSLEGLKKAVTDLWHKTAVDTNRC
jgi:dephospho-CoA kinase